MSCFIPYMATNTTFQLVFHSVLVFDLSSLAVFSVEVFYFNPLKHNNIGYF